MLAAALVAGVMGCSSGGGAAPPSVAAAGTWTIQPAHLPEVLQAPGSGRGGDPSVSLAWQDGSTTHVATDAGVAGSSDGTSWVRELTPWPPAAGSSFAPRAVLVLEDRTLLVGSMSGSEGLRDPSSSRGDDPQPWRGEGSAVGPSAPGAHAMVWSTTDHGAHWSPVDDPAAGRPEVFGAGELYAVADTPKGIVVLGVLHSGADLSAATPAAWRSTDRGATWSRLDLAGAHLGAHAFLSSIATLGESVVVSGSDDTGPVVRATRDLVQWDDAGRLDLPVSLAGDGSRLVALASELPSDVKPDAPILWTSTQVGQWVPVARDPGVFGDGGTGEYSYSGAQTRLTIQRSRDAFVIEGSVQERSAPQFCFQDLASCQVQTTVVATSQDGARWARVAAEEQRTGRATNAFVAYVQDSAPAAIITMHIAPLSGSSTTRARNGGNAGATRELQLWRWSGVDAPARLVPSAPTTTEPPRPMLERNADLAVGASARVQWYTGGCSSGLSVGGRVFEVVAPGLPAVQPDWPVRGLQVADGPSMMVLGTVTRVGPDELTFTVEGTDTTIRLVPATKPSFGCS